MTDRLTRFTKGQRIRVATTDDPLTGYIGTVVRKRKADEAAWVEMDHYLPDGEAKFPFGDDRHKHVLLWPEDCEGITAS